MDCVRSFKGKFNGRSLRLQAALILVMVMPRSHLMRHVVVVIMYYVIPHANTPN